MLIVDSFLGDLIAVFITFASLILCHHWFYGYWSRRKVPCLQSIFSSSKQHLGIKFKQVYDTMKTNGWKCSGVFLQLSPILVIGHLELVKNIMTKDFDHFPHRGLYYNETGDPLSYHIFNTSGEKWKSMRTKLNQIFTPGKLKTMFHFLQNCERNLVLESLVEVDVKKVADGFVSNVIESCVFGLDCQVDGQSLFEEFGRRIFRRSRTRRLKGFIVDNFPRLGHFLNIALIPKDASSFFLKTIQDAVIFRKQNNIVRQDFLQVLTEVKNEDGTFLSVEEIAAQCFIFFLAGMSTSPTAITFALYELAKHVDIQDEVRHEIASVLEQYQGKITYEAIHDLRYLDKVLDESLRKYPPAAYLNRKCVKDYKLSNGVVIEKGTTLVIPILGIHHDEDFYLNPERFDPGRFNEDETRARHGYAFLPFGEGPRICIGMRFGLLQSKLALVSLIKNYRVTVNGKTQEPLKMKPGPLVLTPEGEIWLDFEKL